MYGECERSQDKKIMMIGVRKGPQEGRCGMKRRNKEKSTAQEENCNSMGSRQVGEEEQEDEEDGGGEQRWRGQQAIK